MANGELLHTIVFKWTLEDIFAKATAGCPDCIEGEVGVAGSGLDALAPQKLFGKRLTLAKSQRT